MPRYVFIGMLSFLLLGAGLAHAQTADPFSTLTQLGANDVDVTFSPENPGPRQVVTVSLKSDAVDLNRSNISWTLQGVTVRNGVGQRSLTFKTLDYGQSVNLSIQIAAPTGESLTKTLSIQPEDMSVLWEATDAYAPAFYKGKKLPGQESLITIAAIPNFGLGTSTKAREASFIWERNGSRLPASSGWQRDSILIKHNALRASELIGVTATNQTGTRNAIKTLEIKPFKQRLLVYGRDTETGVTTPYAIKGLTTTKPIILIAQPFGFSQASSSALGLSFDWLINGSSVFSDLSHQSVLVNPPADKGVTRIQTKVTSSGYTLQNDSYATDIIFQ